MRAHRVSCIVILVNVLFWTSAAACGQGVSEVRKPAVAGQFYPADAVKLRLSIQGFMKDAVPVAVEDPIALVVPHAGYVFSGQVTADAFHQAEGRLYDTVVILGTNHTTPGFAGISLQPHGAYRTPLGDAPVDEAVAAVLLSEDKDCKPDPIPQAREHSVEVQVPFVQVLFPAARIVPAVIGEPDLAMCRHFGEVLAKALKGKRALIVASSDLSHYPGYDDAVRVDRETLQAIALLDADGFSSRCRKLAGGAVPRLDTLACGEAPILAAISAAKSLGAVRGVVVSYANSGDALVGEKQQVVGYGAVALTAGKASDKATPPPHMSASANDPLQAADKKALLQVARETLRRYLTTDTVPLVRGLNPRLECPQGAFVTLKKHGELRGCIGHFPADTPLGRTVGRVALEAALNDSRFPQVIAQELPDIEIEISALTIPRSVSDPNQIRLGRDGVILEKDGRSATFLPQVATEQGWGLDAMLDNLCRKAGLPAGSWRKGARFQVYQAEVFDESQFK